MADINPAPARWLRVVLFASLALNLAGIGALVGLAVTGGPDRQHGPRGRDAAFPYARALDTDDRDRLRQQLHEDFRSRRGAVGEIAQDYRAAVTLLEADPFDRAAFEELMLRQDARAELRQEAGRRALLDVLTEMTPEARRAYAGRLSEQIDRFEARIARRDD